MGAQPDSPEITIRPAQQEDIAGMAEISIEAFRGHGGSLEAATTWISALIKATPAYRYWVAVVGERVVGFISWRQEGALRRPRPVIELDQLAVRSDSQGRGIGSKLIEQSLAEFLDSIRKTNPALGEEIVAVVWVYALNHAAVRTYEAAGFNLVAGYRHQYGDPESMMLRRIPVKHVRDRVGG